MFNIFEKFSANFVHNLYTDERMDEQVAALLLLQVVA